MHAPVHRVIAGDDDFCWYAHSRRIVTFSKRVQGWLKNVNPYWSVGAFLAHPVYGGRGRRIRSANERESLTSDNFLGLLRMATCMNWESVYKNGAIKIRTANVYS